MEFCRNAKCAKLTIKIDGAEPLTFISKFPPLTVEEPGEEIFTHEMTAPIERKFPFLIKDVEFVEGFWFCNKPEASSGLIQLSCPMPGTYPYVDAGGGFELQKGSDTSDLYWIEDKLYCYFEPIDRRQWEIYYPNNRGQCTYKVLGSTSYKFYDKRGVIYQAKPGEKLTYEVECDACCKDNEIMCDHHTYPGYKCYPIPPINAKLLKGQNEITRFWR